MREMEDHYWWFVGRREAAISLIKSYLHLDHPTILDLGCGTGAVTLEAAKLGPTVGVDMSADALRFNSERPHPEKVLFALGDGIALPVASNSVDAIVALDVYEHIERDDMAFLESFRALKPGGVLVLSVPAFRWLWGPHDVALHHFRRYHRAELRTKLESAGFQVEKLTFAVFFLFPLVVLMRALDKFKRGPARAQLPPVPGWLNQALIGLLSFEMRLAGRVSGLPWGSSLVVVGRKKSVDSTTKLPPL